MKKLSIPEGLSRKDLIKFLVENKTEIINERKSLLKFTDSISVTPRLFHVKSTAANKSEVIEVIDEEADAGSGSGSMATTDGDQLRVKVVANTCNWCDSQMDVLLPDCWKRSIKQRKSFIPHLHDHIHSIEAKVGEVADIYSQDMNLTDLGVNAVGYTQVLIFETDIFKLYNEKIFNQYKLKKIKQHSIGLQYVKIELAVNDEGYEKEMDFWNKYYPQVINKEVVDEKGFFWVVSEIKLLENSCVLFGSNELTPTLDAKSSTGKQSPSGTGNHSQTDDESGSNKSIDWEKMAAAISIS